MSLSATASLDKLSVATDQLSQRVASLGSLIVETRESSSLPSSPTQGSSLRSPRPSVSLPASPSLTMSTSDKKRTRTCHSCHAPTDIHTQIPTGINICPLPHWDGCPGGHADGKDSKGREWRGCPSTFTPAATSMATGSSSSVSSNGSQRDEFEDSVSYIPQSEVFKDPENEESSEEITKTMKDLNIEDDSSPTDDPAAELQQLQERNRILKEQFARHQAAKLEQQKLEISRQKLLIEADNARLVSEMSGDIGGVRARTAQTPRNPQHAPQGSQSLPRVTPEQTRPPASGSVSWHHSFQQHLTKNQVKAAQKKSADPQIYTGLDMNGIRKIPKIRETVEDLVNQVQDRVPSLDRRPTASLAFLSDQASNGQPAAPEIMTTEEDFIYLRKKDGTLSRVPVVCETQGQDISPSGRKVGTGFARKTGYSSSSSGLPAAGPPDEDPLASSDDDCPIQPSQGWRHVWRRLPNGQKYFTEEPAVSQISEIKYEWVKDPVTGRISKTQVQFKQQQQHMDLRWVIDPTSGKEMQMLVPKSPPRVSTTLVKASTQQNSKSNDSAKLVDYRRQSAILPLAQHGHVPSCISPVDDNQGKENKTPAIIKYARLCPVAWTSKVTSEKLNMGLWSWAFISELLATRTGRAPDLGPGELEARMQHFLNVLEIALQQSSVTDFEGQSWKVARLYAEKVQQKIDRGNSWLVFQEKYGADSHPHELMAAQIELAPKPKVQVKAAEGTGRAGTGRAVGAGTGTSTGTGTGTGKRPCTTWNSSQVENKCQFEIDFEGRECDRKHECSWCKEKNRRSLPHQRSFCRQRLAAGEQ